MLSITILTVLLPFLALTAALPSPQIGTQNHRAGAIHARSHNNEYGRQRRCRVYHGTTTWVDEPTYSTTPAPGTVTREDLVSTPDSLTSGQPEAPATTSAHAQTGTVETAKPPTPVQPTSAEVPTSVKVTPTSTAFTTTKAPYNGGSSNLTPNGIKAGISAGDSFDYVKDHIGWWYDWSATPSGHSGTPIAVPMLWGAGIADSTDWERLQAFKGLDYHPTWIIGFEEPDCASGGGSAGVSVSHAVAVWNELMVPHGNAGSLLLSPSMCHQLAEDYLEPFEAEITRTWDITNVHINKNSADGIRASIDYYYNRYKRPIWVTEFACVDDSTGFWPCTDQGEINDFIWTAVQIFESDSRVAAYAYSNGMGLGNIWPMMSGNQLSESGQTYLAAISQYH